MTNYSPPALRTDMALELLKGKRAKGCETDVTRGDHGLKRTVVTIGDEAAAREIGKPVGKYYTLELKTPYKRAADIKEYAAREIGYALSDALAPIGGGSILIACLGNKSMAADSLGPLIMEKLIVTRHLKTKIGNLCAVAPGVLGVTGIETYDILAAIVGRIKPDAVIAADTLAAGSVGRLASAFQIADSGITPGAGVGNRRPRLCEETLGVPVIAVGVPLVVYASTIVNEVLRGRFDSEQDEKRLSSAERAAFDLLGDTIVTLKDIDFAVKECANILALAINSAIHGLDVREAAELMN